VLKLGKIIIKKMKAYPKLHSLKPYLTSFCYICNDEYLTQGIVDEEKEKCPACKYNRRIV
jgi:RNA polymerase subunit RPABC4/transcription elongation factor Spt4